MCWTTHNPRTARTRPPRLVTTCPSCACPSRVRQAGMSTMGTRSDWIRHANDPKPPRGGPTGGGGRPPGLHPLPPPQTTPHNPSTLCWQARARDGRAGGGGTVTQPRDWPTGVGPPYSSPGQSDPPRVQRCRCRLFRQRAVSATPSSTPPFTGIKVAGEAG